MELMDFSYFLDNRVHSDEEIMEMARQVYKEWKKQEQIADVGEIEIYYGYE